MAGWRERMEQRRQSRRLWDVMVERANAPFNSYDGSTAARAVKPPDVPNWVEPGKETLCAWLMDSGRVPWSTSEQYLHLMDMYRNGEMKVDEYVTVRKMIGKISQYRDCARRMRWEITPQQSAWLQERGK